MIRDLLRLHTILAVNTVARVLDDLLTKHFPSEPPPGAWHPSLGDRPVIREPRPFTEAELEEAHEEFVSAQVRALLVDRCGWRYPPASVYDQRACEAMWALGTYDKEDH